jgi:hypothetical protein
VAKAEKRSEVITIKRDTVRLELTTAEAEVLAALLDKVGGSPKNSARVHADSIAVALRGAGVRGMATGYGHRYPQDTLGGVLGLTMHSNRHASELITPGSNGVVFREYPASWTKAERGEDNGHG